MREEQWPGHGSCTEGVMRKLRLSAPLRRSLLCDLRCPLTLVLFVCSPSPSHAALSCVVLIRWLPVRRSPISRDRLTPR